MATAQASSSKQLPSWVLEDQTSMSIQVTAARSRDEQNVQIMKGFAEHRLPPPGKSASAPILTGEEVALPAPTPSGASPSIAFKNLLSLSDSTIKSHLNEMRGLLADHKICVPCFIHHREYSHGSDQCTEVAVGYDQNGSKYRSWKSKLDLPNGQCFRCCYPQVSV